MREVTENRLNQREPSAANLLQKRARNKMVPLIIRLAAQGAEGGGIRISAMFGRSGQNPSCHMSAEDEGLRIGKARDGAVREPRERRPLPVEPVTMSHLRSDKV